MVPEQVHYVCVDCGQQADTQKLLHAAEVRRKQAELKRLEEELGVEVQRAAVQAR
jgi:DNA-directed RNA polymerase subunit RPC12/RpoP